MNILILSASTGGGHNRASNALKSYISKQDSTIKIDIVDTFAYCSSMLNKIVTVGYELLATKVPELYGVMYKSSDKENIGSDIVNSLMSQIAKKIYPMIDEYKPDIIISCHPFASNMLSVVKEKFPVSIPVISIITDYMPHRAYLGDNIDAYVTPSKESAYNLSIKYGVDSKKIFPFGIPIFQNFSNYDESRIESTYEQLGFTPDKPTVLIMAGSFGVTDILKIYENIVDLESDCQIIVITGRNKRLYDAFEKLLNQNIEEFETHDYTSVFDNADEAYIADYLCEHSDEARKFISPKLKKLFKRSTNKMKPTHLLYFVDNVEDYMHISDIIITKPGGLTTSESLACGLPMAVFKAFPGQEMQNADYLVQNNTAIMLEQGAKGAKQIEHLLNNPDELSAMKENCIRCSHKDSAEKIYNLILDMHKNHTQDYKKIIF